jgi:hypothetical protein
VRPRDDAGEVRRRVAVELRATLASAYPLDRQSPEVGRWGYPIGPHASQEERTAFGAHAFAGYLRVSEARLARLVRAEDLAVITDESGRALLRAWRAAAEGLAFGLAAAGKGLIEWTVSSDSPCCGILKRSSA